MRPPCRQRRLYRRVFGYLKIPSPFRGPGGCPLALAFVVILSTYVPEILVQGLVARLFLRIEGGSVGSDSPQVLAACLYSSADSAKSLTCQSLVGGDGSGSGDGLDASQIDPTAIRAGCRSHAVRCQQHLLVGCMRGLFVDFT